MHRGHTFHTAIVSLLAVLLLATPEVRGGMSLPQSFGRSSREPLPGSMPQAFSPPNCTKGWENEIWVARAFWDLHDTRSDGDDILWFIHKGAVLALYLSNGIAEDGDAKDMRDYEDIYRDAASPGHQTFISDIFNQNRT